MTKDAKINRVIVGVALLFSLGVIALEYYVDSVSSYRAAALESAPSVASTAAK